MLKEVPDTPRMTAMIQDMASGLDVKFLAMALAWERLAAAKAWERELALRDEIAALREQIRELKKKGAPHA